MTKPKRGGRAVRFAANSRGQPFGAVVLSCRQRRWMRPWIHDGARMGEAADQCKQLTELKWRMKFPNERSSVNVSTTCLKYGDAEGLQLALVSSRCPAGCVVVAASTTCLKYGDAEGLQLALVFSRCPAGCVVFSRCPAGVS